MLVGGVRATDPGSVWPLPTSIQCTSGAAVQLHTGARIGVASDSQHSDALDKAVQIYTNILKPLAVDSGSVQLVWVKVTSAKFSLTTEVDASYNISFDSVSSTVNIVAVTPVGAQYGLETVSQLLGQGGFTCKNLFIQDSPQYARRGLFLDVAHRYVPVDTLQTIVQGMAFAKMNVLHMHFGDTGNVRVSSTTYDSVVDSVNGYYTPDDITAISAYASTYSVIVVPSISLPSHADGFSGIDDVKFCPKDDTIVYDDAEGTTVKALAKYVEETQANFAVPHYFISAYPAAASDGCSQDKIDSVTAKITDLLLAAGSSVGAFPSITSVAGVMASENIHILAQAADNITKLLAQKYSVVYGGSNHNYDLNTSSTPPCTGVGCYYDNITVYGAGVLGAVASAWTNNYCTTIDCAGGSTNPNAAAFMQSRDQDDVFAQSIVALIFPRAALVSGSAWSAVPLNTTVLQAAQSAMSTLLVARGVGACTCGTCTESTGCSGAYAQQSYSIKTVQAGMGFAIGLFTSLMVLILVSLFYKGSRGNRSGYTRVN